MSDDNRENQLEFSFKPADKISANVAATDNQSAAISPIEIEKISVAVADDSPNSAKRKRRRSRKKSAVSVMTEDNAAMVNENAVPFGIVAQTSQEKKVCPPYLPGMSKEGIYFIALGGAEKVGMNMYAYIVDGKIIVVDAGYDFLNDEFPGIDLGLADPSFLENYQDCIEALFITHSHEDHFGAIAHIWPRLRCPIYATDFTIGHVIPRLREYKLDTEAEIHSVNEQPVVKLENFEVEYVPVAHSLPENSALVIRTKYGNVFHATDWRFDNQGIEFMKTDFQRLEQIGREGIQLYVGDSIQMNHSKPQPSENEIRQSLIDLLPRYENTLVATCFASNVARMESLILAAHEAGRTPVIAGMSLIQNMKIAKECGFLKDLPPVVEARQAQDIPLDKMLYICAGSQANYRSGLTRIVNGENKDIKLGKGDAIIFSSQIIPGNEDKIERMQEKLRDAGVDVITSEEYLVHTSGHGTREEVARMLSLIKPKVMIPVHGDKRCIREQKRFAIEQGVDDVVIARDGDVIRIDRGRAEVVGEVPTDELGVDRKQVISLNSPVVKNRKRIAYNCSLFITAVLDENWHVEDLQITSIDILDEQSFAELADTIKTEMLKSIPIEVVKLNYRAPQIEEYIRAKIRKMIYKATDIKPVTFMHFYKKGLIADSLSGETE